MNPFETKNTVATCLIAIPNHHKSRHKIERFGKHLISYNSLAAGKK
jgi:acetate kinase